MTDDDLVNGLRNFDFVDYILKPSLSTSVFDGKQTILRSAHTVYRVIRNDCRGFNNLSHTIHLRQEYMYFFI